ncbi:tigger transposable element-derived protein 1 [Trichonephila clavipes]|nr:tigger transposable element-derived protein 1 [Trichonephila clavipes]
MKLKNSTSTQVERSFRKMAEHFIWPNGEKKHQRQSILLETKIAILDRLGKGEGSTAIGKHFNLGESTVRAIKKNEAAIRKSVISGTKLSTKFASYIRDVLLERTERAIAIWIEEQVQRRIPISGYLIQEKALQFYKSMKQSEPPTSTSQADNRGESATADEGAAKIFPEELAKIIEDGDYSADQVFNADETGLYWKKLPNRTYIAKDEKTASGHKANGVVGLEGDNDEEEKSTPLTGKLFQEGLQLCSKLENYFLINAPNSERASKLQRRATQNENEVCENPWPLPQISIAETVSSDDEEPDEIDNLIGEDVDLSRQTNSEVDSDDVQGLLDSHNQWMDS